jgi:PAS domain S-box-containing protein
MPSEALPRGKFILLLTVFVAIVVLVFDLSLPLGVAGGVPYVVLVLIALWSPWRNYIYLMAVLGTVLTVVGYFASPAGGIPWVVLTNRVLAIFAIWVTAVLCARIQKDKMNLHTVIDTAAEGIISIDDKGVIQAFNKAAEVIFGYTEHEVLGRNVSLLMPSPIREQHNDYIKRYLDTGKSRIIGIGQRLQARHKDGHLIPIYLNVSAALLGRHYSFTGIIRDLSMEEKKEDQLQQLWRSVEQSPVSIIITDVDGKIEYVNPHFCQVTGYRPEEVLGENPRILKSGQTPSEDYHQLWETITSGNVWRGALKNRKKNGELFWESATICPVRDQNDDITHYIALKEDITDRLETKDQLTHALKMEVAGQLTSGIAHDFNNLLTIITGNLQLLLEDIRDINNKEIKELLDDALSASLDGEELINQLMFFSRRKEHRVYRVNINVVIKDIHRFLSRILGENIEIKINLAEDINAIQVNSSQLEGVILNLAVNARDAMPDGGVFTIETERKSLHAKASGKHQDLKPGNYIILTVKDTGIGMAPDVVARASEPFYTTKDTGKGTGLGLSMARGFAKQSEGKLLIMSKLGIGTEISLFLPEINQTIHEDKAGEMLQNMPHGTETILIVEDKKNVRRFAVRGLKNLGYQALEADNADKAMELLANDYSIDLLFSDIVIPGKKNGRELARWAATQRPDLKVSLTTGAYKETREKHDDNFPVLKKPYSLEQLAQYIREQLDTSQSNH